MAKTKLKFEARQFRSQGMSIKQIARDLGVSTSTVSLWCTDIKLTPEQIKQLENQARDPYYGRRLSYSLKQQYTRKVKEEDIKIKAKKEIGILTQRELLVAGIALYWAEGFKKDKMAGFANSDPEMVKFAINWLTHQLKIPMSMIKLRVGLNELHKYREKDIQHYWSKLTNVPISHFYKPFYQRVVWQKTYEHPEEYFGTLRIRVLKSTDLLRKIKGMIEGLKYNIAMAG